MDKLRWPLFILLTLAFLGLLQVHDTIRPQSSGDARIGGAFTLTATNGHTVKESSLRGKPMLVYMGYTHCPDICPITLGIMGDALQLLGLDANKVAVLFITMDPERDTPKVLGSYLKNFDARIIGLTGTRAEIEAVSKNYAAYSKKVVMPANENYLVDHSGNLYLMDKKGKYAAHFSPDVKADELARALREQL